MLPSVWLLLLRRKVLRRTHSGPNARIDVGVASPTEVLAPRAGRGVQTRSFLAHVEAPTVNQLLRWASGVELAYHSTLTVIRRIVVHRLPRVGVDRG